MSESKDFNMRLQAVAGGDRMKIASVQNYFIGGRTMAKSEERYTIEDIEALPEGVRAELFDGVMYMMAPPSTSHQRISGYLFTDFYNYIKKNEGNCEVFHAPFAVYLSGKDNYVEPDIVVICDKSKLDEKGCHGAPDLVVEIVSPSSEKNDYILKLFKYRTEGVREYWIVDERKNRIMVYDFEQDELKEYSFSDKVPVGIYEGRLEIEFGTM